MKVLFITQYLFGNDAASIVERNTIKMLLMKNHVVTVKVPISPFGTASYFCSFELLDHLNTLNWQPSRTTLVYRILQHTLGQIGLLVSFLRSKGNSAFDVVTAMYQPSTWSAIIAALISKVLRVPLLLRCHDLPIPSPPSAGVTIASEFLNVPNILSFAFAQKITVVSSEQKILFISRFRRFSKKLSLLPNCVETYVMNEPFNSEPKTDSMKDFTVLSLESAEYRFREHALEILIRSISLVPKAECKVKLLLIGRKINIKRIKSLASELGIEENVRCIENVPHHCVQNIIRNASLGVGPLVFPNGSISLKVLEYMAASKPVVAAVGCVSRDLLVDGYNGFNINRLDAQEIAEKISVLVSNPHLKEKLGKNAFLHILSNFDIDVVANKLDILLSSS